MSSREIVLWLDERWYDALERHLKNETLQERLESFLDELCNHLLPDYEYEQISKEVYEERMERDVQREAARRFAVFRVIERGEQSFFLVEQPIDILAAARAMRHYVSGESASDFRHYYATAADITPEEYERYVIERTENTGRVCGAFDIDFDAGTIDALNITDGWHRFAIRDVRTAAYHADRKSNESPDDRLAKLLNYLTEHNQANKNSARSPKKKRSEPER